MVAALRPSTPSERLRDPEALAYYWGETLAVVFRRAQERQTISCACPQCYKIIDMVFDATGPRLIGRTCWNCGKTYTWLYTDSTGPNLFLQAIINRVLGRPATVIEQVPTYTVTDHRIGTV